jgi:hypothetical protein
MINISESRIKKKIIKYMLLFENEEKFYDEREKVK